jgi:hypothetical protein
MEQDARADYDAVVREIVSSSGATTGAMFGMPCLKHGGKAFAGFYQGAMVFKLGGEAHAQALALTGAHLFDPSGRGRAMKEWVVVPHEHAKRWGELVREALDYCVVTNSRSG